MDEAQPHPGMAPVALADVADALSGCFVHGRHIVLAVSGGSDSMALMQLAAAWRRQQGVDPPSLSVVTVDHRLRSDSAAEAEAVAAAAHRLGIEHALLPWVGPKPRTGLQAAAREMRYRLIAEHMRERRWRVLATGHTADDQAETLLMRLARGSGVDGLAGMGEITMRGPILVVRPLLGVAKAGLQAMLRERGIGWSEDPSNSDISFERSRWRQARSGLDVLGLTIPHLTASARRLTRARHALAWATNSFVEQAGEHLRVHDLGYADLSWPWLTALPEEVRLRILSALIRSIGGQTRQLSLGRLEALTERRDWRSPAGRTLGGVAFADGPGDRVVLTRETGRGNLPVVELVPGAGVDWDNRFTLYVSVHLLRPVRVAALGRDGLSWLIRHAAVRRPPVPVGALRALPGLWRDNCLVAAPPLGYIGPDIDPTHVRCAFTNLPFRI